ncbi:hypothetical protein E3P99_00492 [Wallemia hederae]|uniref:Inclusion body clearance protein iml2 n=1 Tax=Wallemia hederae TaxID=1540922 RepID=A0A4T0FVM9_9BASI|nr:hypothetical protein E3P99_00492 [Wallemia hederae]
MPLMPLLVQAIENIIDESVPLLYQIMLNVVIVHSASSFLPIIHVISTLISTTAITSLAYHFQLFSLPAPADDGTVETHSALLDLLRPTTEGFNLLFNDKIDEATIELQKHDNAYGRTGLGIILFLQAALGMEEGVMERAQDELFQAEKAADTAKRECSYAKGGSKSRFATTAPYVRIHSLTNIQNLIIIQELLIASTVIGQAMTQILTESSVEMLKAIYKLNRSYKLYNNTFSSVFPGGAASLPDTPLASPSISRQQSSSSLNKPTPPKPQPQKGFLAKKFGSFLGVGGASTPITPPAPPADDMEEFVMSGACFGFGLFGLVFSLMPPKLKKLINVFGFKSDRKEALKALALSASYKDVHSSFAALALLFYTSSTLLLAGWNADSEHDMRMFENILKSCEKRHPEGTLWTLNRAKLERINGNADKALEILGSTLKKDGGFPQAEVIIVFEYAWLLLAENNSWLLPVALARGRHWEEPRESARGVHEGVLFPRLVSHANEKHKVPNLLNAKKLGGRNMPMEDFAQRKIAFWKRKHERRVAAYKKQGIDVAPERWDMAIKISPADEMACFWNSYGKITRQAAIKHMSLLCQLTPAPEIRTPLVDVKESEGGIEDLDTLDEKAVRYLLLGILHRAIGELDLARRYLDECVSYRGQITDDTWAPAFAAYELAVLELNQCDKLTTKKKAESSDTSSAASFSTANEADATGAGTVDSNAKEVWRKGIEASEKHLALVASGAFGATYDLEGRQGTRMYLLKDEIQTKKAQLGL